MPSPRPLLIAVMGPTGSGKSNVAEKLADVLNAVLVNADAFQVYQGLDIGTNKPAPAIRHRYRLLDLVPPTHEFGVGEWLRETLPVLQEAYAQNRHVIVVGGTGFYIRALFEEFDALKPPPDPALRQSLESRPLPEILDELKKLSPDTYGQIDRQNPVRVTRALEKLLTPAPAIKIQLPPFQKLKFALVPQDEELRLSLRSRLEKMLKEGWQEEIETILSQEIPKDSPGLRAIGYHPLIEFCEGASTLEEAKSRIVNQTWQYAKRQKTWLRREPGLVQVPVTPLTNEGIEKAFLDLKSKTLEVLGKKENGKSN